MGEGADEGQVDGGRRRGIPKTRLDHRQKRRYGRLHGLTTPEVPGSGVVSSRQVKSQLKGVRGSLL